MNVIEANGVRLSFVEAGSGPAVILAHGIPNDYRVWAPLVGGLSGSYRTISYSRRCAVPNQFRDYASSTIENNVRDLEELIAETGGGPVHLVGHSYGGPVVALCALRRPELVRSLVLIEPYLPGLVVNQRSMLDSLSLLVRKPSLAVSGLRSLGNIKAAVRGVVGKDLARTLDAYYAKTWERGDVKVPLSASDRAMMLDNMETFRELESGSPTFAKADAARIVAPTLIMTGEHTIKYMRAVTMELHRHVPHSQVAVIRNASHYPHMENPRECSDAILKFLSEEAR